MPVPSYTDTIERFLREDGTWEDLSNYFKPRPGITAYDDKTDTTVTNHVDINNTAIGNAEFKVLKNGTYRIQRKGYTDLLVSFYAGGSASSLELMTSWHESDSLMFRRTVDAKRFADKSWRTLLDSSNYTSWVYNKSTIDELIIDTKTYIDNKIAALVNSAPATLDTLGEIAEYLQKGTVTGDMITYLSQKVNKSGDIMTGDLIFAAGDTDKFIKFDSSSEGKGGTHSWRIGYLGSGSGDNSLFVL